MKQSRSLRYSDRFREIWLRETRKTPWSIPSFHSPNPSASSRLFSIQTGLHPGLGNPRLWHRNDLGRRCPDLAASRLIATTPYHILPSDAEPTNIAMSASKPPSPGCSRRPLPPRSGHRVHATCTGSNGLYRLVPIQKRGTENRSAVRIAVHSISRAGASPCSMMASDSVSYPGGR
jgi:hypothetical protein